MYAAAIVNNSHNYLDLIYLSVSPLFLLECLATVWRNIYFLW